MNWRKYLTVITIIATIVLFVIAVRQNDTNGQLKEQLGNQYALNVQNFRNYIQDLQSANDSGETISTNHFYSEVHAFPIKNKKLADEMDTIHKQLMDESAASRVSGADRKKLSEKLNKLQLTLLDIMRYSGDDEMKWYEMVNSDDEGIQKQIDKHYKD